MADIQQVVNFQEIFQWFKTKWVQLRANAVGYANTSIQFVATQSSLFVQFIGQIHVHPDTTLLRDIAIFGSLARLLCIPRVMMTFTKLEEHISFFWFRLIRLAIVLIVWIHISGGWFYVLAVYYLNRENTWIGVIMGSDFISKSVWTRYMISIYWAITTLTSVGYGDIHPINHREMEYAAAIMVFNIIILCYVGDNLSSLYSYWKNGPTKMEFAIKLAKKMKLSQEDRDLLIGNLLSKRDNQHIQDTIDDLPRSTVVAMVRNLFHSCEENIYLLRDVDRALFLGLPLKIQSFYVADDVFVQNERSLNLCILVEGSVDILNNGEVVRVEKKGAVLGAYGALLDRDEVYGVQAREYCQVLQLERTSFIRFMRRNAIVWTRIMTNLDQHLEELEQVDATLNAIHIHAYQILHGGFEEN
ncbi:hypothetical protein ACFE04_001854 [Oxalis oulophora]